ncbi:MAG: 2 3-bisphosphoglycerate-independent phosphoglycerate mutase [Nitrospirae bacterium]|nr:MAG: 2 3-bisphosphoglycerate-independent phosphoglycerate mutase [Nitrospirota bacterium]
MKYVVIIGDGMADRPIAELGGLTPLQKAHTPNMDRLAQQGIIGISHTIPQGFHPGSDVANLSIMGYDPARYYTGRAPLEAASIGVAMNDTDVAYRCNLVTLRTESDASMTMEDYSSGHITTEEAGAIITTLAHELKSDAFDLYPGVSYRHLLVWHNGSTSPVCIAPHDILEKRVAEYLPSGKGSDFIRDLMNRSVAILAQHSVNKKRIAEGKRPATSIWLWGQGKRPALPSYQEQYGISGALVSAVDLTKGLGIYAGFEILKVPGVTGWIDTNYAGKAQYALDALERVDYVYIHVEAPDEAGHSGNVQYKLQAIEDLDAKVVGPVLKGLKERFSEYRVLLMPDHATPIFARTHTSEPVPFVIFDSRKPLNQADRTYDERIADREDSVVFERGFTLMNFFIRGQ